MSEDYRSTVWTRGTLETERGEIDYEAEWTCIVYHDDSINVELREVQYDEQVWGPLSQAEMNQISTRDWANAMDKADVMARCPERRTEPEDAEL